MRPFSLANCAASLYVTSRCSAMSDLLPIRKMTVCGFVKLFASVSQLARWLNVLRLRPTVPRAPRGCVSVRGWAAAAAGSQRARRGTG